MLTGTCICYVVNADWFFLSHRLPLAEAARARGADVVVIAGDSGRRGEVERRGFRFVDLPISRSGRNPLRDANTCRSLWRVYRAVRPDLVHHVTLKPVIYGSIAARAAGVPAVVNAVSGLGYVFLRDSRAGLARRVIRGLLPLAVRHPHSALIVQNPDDRALFQAMGWAPKGRLVMIRGSGVDGDRFRPAGEPPSPPYIVMLASRMLWDKGVAEFVEAARRLKTRGGPRTRFVLVGGTDPENPASIPPARLEAWVREEVVEWWGHRQDMEKVLPRAHVVVLPSYGEGLPKVLLEAAACGRALVTTDVRGCREVVRDGENGLLVPPRDGEALARAIFRLVADDDLRVRMSLRGRSLVEAEFSLDRVVAETMSVYRSLLECGHRGLIDA